MANSDREFRAFESAITPSIEDLERSLEMRRSIRRAIVYYCSNRNVSVSFHPQGSFRLLTAVRRGGLDLDDGLLFSNNSFRQMPSIESLHEMVFAALHDAAFPVFARQPCLRILQPRGLRTDIVIYLTHADGRVYLAHRTEGWVPVHSSHLIAWFERPFDALSSAQMRRLIKYYKMWSVRMQPHKMASGLAMSILVHNLIRPADRDDVALVDTMQTILDHLQAGKGCVRPTPPIGEELLRKELCESQFNSFLDLLRSFLVQATRALVVPGHEESIAIWQGLFGPTFGIDLGEVSSCERAMQLRLILEDDLDPALLKESATIVPAEGGQTSWIL